MRSCSDVQMLSHPVLPSKLMFRLGASPIRSEIIERKSRPQAIMSWLSKWFLSPSTKKRPADGDIHEPQAKKPRVLFSPQSSAEDAPEGSQAIEIFGAAEARSLGALTASSLVPRPLTLVAALDKNGELSITTTSFCALVSESPTYICIGLNKDPFPDDTDVAPAEAIEKTKDLTVSIVSEWIVKAAATSPGTYALPSNSTEADLKTGLTTSESLEVSVPRISEAAVALECKLRHRYHIKDSFGDVTSTVVIAEVLCAAAKKGVLTESAEGLQLVDLSKLRPVATVGDGLFAQLSTPYSLPGLKSSEMPTTPPSNTEKLPQQEVAEAVANAVADALEAEGEGPTVQAVEVTLASGNTQNEADIPVTVTQAD